MEGNFYISSKDSNSTTLLIMAIILLGFATISRKPAGPVLKGEHGAAFKWQAILSRE